MSVKNTDEILITGGTGLLGNGLCNLLEQHRAGFTVSTHRLYAMQTNMIFMDLTTGEGIAAAIKGRKVIIHLASDKKNPDNDVLGIRNLLAELKQLHQQTHLIYVSIVGTDRVSLPYFKQKWQVEQIIMQSGQPYTILRATQFHKYMETVLRQLLKWPVGILPKKIPVQPIDVQPVAAALLRLMQEQPMYKTVEMGGEEIISLGEAASTFLAVEHKKRIIINMPLWGNNGKNLLTGALTSRQRASGSARWKTWLEKI